MREMQETEKDASMMFRQAVADARRLRIAKELADSVRHFKNQRSIASRSSRAGSRNIRNSETNPEGGFHCEIA